MAHTTIKMAYIPDNLQVSSNDLDAEINQLGNSLADVNLLVKIDYVYHHRDNNYDGGLSMLDRINAKLGRNRVNPWNIESMKDNIRNSMNRQRAFMETIESMFPTLSEIEYYGL